MVEIHWVCFLIFSKYYLAPGVNSTVGFIQSTIALKFGYIYSVIGREFADDCWNLQSFFSDRFALEYIHDRLPWSPIASIFRIFVTLGWSGDRFWVVIESIGSSFKTGKVFLLLWEHGFRNPAESIVLHCAISLITYHPCCYPDLCQVSPAISFCTESTVNLSWLQLWLTCNGLY